MTQFASAEKEYVVAERIDPNDPDTHFARGRCLQVLGFRAEAVKEFMTAKALYADVENDAGYKAAQAQISAMA
jgi:Flp pilus assembly protein TadD